MEAAGRRQPILLAACSMLCPPPFGLAQATEAPNLDLTDLLSLLQSLPSRPSIPVLASPTLTTSTQFDDHADYADLFLLFSRTVPHRQRTTRHQQQRQRTAARHSDDDDAAAAAEVQSSSSLDVNFSLLSVLAWHLGLVLPSIASPATERFVPLWLAHLPLFRLSLCLSSDADTGV